jgi:septal ring factor EnvC (AmiA/AmiB activator)
MSLTASDIQEIRNVVESALNRQTNEIITPIQDEIRALRNDIKEIYDMLAEIHKNSSSAEFDKLTLEQKILDLNSKLVKAAKQAGINLPR